jgi:hypothetical protein
MAECLQEQGIRDARLATAAQEIYRAIFDVFDADSFGSSLTAFMQIILRP